MVDQPTTQPQLFARELVGRVHDEACQHGRRVDGAAGLAPGLPESCFPLTSRPRYRALGSSLLHARRVAHGDGRPSRVPHEGAP